LTLPIIIVAYLETILEAVTSRTCWKRSVTSRDNHTSIIRRIPQQVAQEEETVQETAKTNRGGGHLVLEHVGGGGGRFGNWRHAPTASPTINLLVNGSWVISVTIVINLQLVGWSYWLYHM
jgi:hypothetical protein